MTIQAPSDDGHARGDGGDARGHARAPPSASVAARRLRARDVGLGARVLEQDAELSHRSPASRCPTVGLVVGAIVIMNIMLVAVAERTREIGIRKSLGARRRDILNQFLVESATLATLGAALGVAARHRVRQADRRGVAAARGRRDLVDLRRRRRRRRRRHDRRHLSGEPRRAARSDRRHAAGDLMSTLQHLALGPARGRGHRARVDQVEQRARGADDPRRRRRRVRRRRDLGGDSRHQRERREGLRVGRPDDVLPQPLSDHVRGVRRHRRHVQVAPQSAAHVRGQQGARTRCRRSAPPARSCR